MDTDFVTRTTLASSALRLMGRHPCIAELAARLSGVIYLNQDDCG